MNLFELDTPRLVVDLDRLERNVDEMATVTRERHVRLRPHTKTHKIPEFALIQLAAGAQGITVAKLGEAEVMADCGIDDILIAYPLWGAEKLGRLRALRERARILVSLDSFEVAEGVARVGREQGRDVEVYLEIDTGHHRLGVSPGDDARQLARRLSSLSGINLTGLLTHAGHAYAAPLATRDEVVAREIRDLVATRAMCQADGLAVTEISVGSTPSARMESLEPGVTEVRPGTYICNDTAMVNLGVATFETCAATVLTTVVGRPSPDRFVIDAGTKCFSSDGVGRSGWLHVMGRPDLTMDFTTEEHGVGTIDLAAEHPLSIGDTLQVIPSHVCPVFNLFDVVTTYRGSSVEGELRVAGRGKVR